MVSIDIEPRRGIHIKIGKREKREVITFFL